MSIKLEVKKHLSGDTPELRHLVPSRLSASVTRQVFVGREVQDFIDGKPPGSPTYLKQAGRTISILERFTADFYITFAMDPFDKLSTSTIARVGPIETGIVDVRVRDPRPAVRVFGGFADVDVLILLTWAPRDSLNFEAEVVRCRAEWDKLFPSHNPVFGTEIENYVSKHFHIG